MWGKWILFNVYNGQAFTDCIYKCLGWVYSLNKITFSTNSSVYFHFFQKYSVKMFANEICIFIFSNFENNKNENSILFSKCNRVFDWQIIVLVNILDQVNLIVISHQNNIGVSSWSRINIRNYTPTNIMLIIFVLWNCNIQKWVVHSYYI